MEIKEAYENTSKILNINSNDEKRPFYREEKSHFPSNKPKNLVIFIQESMGAQFVEFSGGEKRTYYLGLNKILLETAQHAIVSHLLGCIRDVAEHGVVYIVIHSLQDRLGQLLAQLLTLLIDILVGTTTEVDALE